MTEFDLKIRSRDIDTLIEVINKHSPGVDIDLVKKAYNFAFGAHKNQKRLSGEPFIVHPLEVAIILANLGMDTATICAALLHDVIEDTGTNMEKIRVEFSEDISYLVDGVTKISTIKNRSKASAQAETLRKMLIATIKDVRVIIIKLADKLHNMRTLMFQPVDKQYRIAMETMDIYAPIAKRLGMSKISSELEDLSFRILYFEEYNEIKNSQALKHNEVEDYIKTIGDILANKFSEMGIKAEMSGRAKHYYSIFRKMQNNEKNFDEIYDIRGIRVITEEIRDCYAILGIIHTIWTPIASRFKDYIAVPKSNMYQSLHTTVMGPGGLPLEVQIRTKKMHMTAEMGVAAHFLYKENRQTSKKDYKDLSLLKNMNEWFSEMKDSRDFMSSLKMDLYEDEIFVFTPKGKIIKLGSGATPVDFAYGIHTEIGNHTTGAKVNSRIVPLKTKLKSGDIVEIITNKASHPSHEWLKFVNSSNAKYKIRNFLKKLNEDTSTEHHDKLEKEEKNRHDKEKVVSVTIPREEQVRLKKITKNKSSGITINGASDIMIKLSQCCQPIPGDDVIGFITRGRGISVHKKSCPSLKRLVIEKERLLNIVWEEKPNRFYPVKISVLSSDRHNLLKDIAEEISSSKSNIIKADAEVKDNENAAFNFVIEVTSQNHLKELISRLKKIKNVKNVFKVNEKVVLK